MTNAVEKILEQAQKLSKQGWTFMSDGEVAKALSHFEQACNLLLVNPLAPAISQKFKEQYWYQLIIYQMNLAEACEKLNNKEKALEIYRWFLFNINKALQVYNKSQNPSRNTIINYWHHAQVKLAQLLEEKIISKADESFAFELFDHYKKMIVNYKKAGNSNKELYYRCKLADLYEKLGFWQTTRSICVDIINTVVNSNSKIEGESKALILNVYKKLAATTANTLEKEFYLFAIKFIAGLSSPQDIQLIFYKIRTGEKQGLSFLLRYFVHLIKPLPQNNPTILGYVKAFKTRIDAIKNEIAAAEKNDELSIESVCLYNAASYISKDIKNPLKQSTIILRVPVYVKETQLVEKYEYYAGDSIGHGTFGSVYAMCDWDKYGKKEQKTLFAAKVVEDPRIFALEETLFADRHLSSPYLRKRDVQSVHYAENKPILLTEFITGVDLKKLCRSPEFNKLSFAARINLVTQVLYGLNSLHHNKPSTGNAIVHADIKDENILVSIDEKGNTNARIIDFGLSTSIADGPDEQKNISNRGSLPNVAVEVFRDKKIGVKTDIYAVTPVILSLLGAKDPLAKKIAILEKTTPEQRIKLQVSKLETVAFDFTGLLDNCPAYLTAVKPLIVLFLQKMQKNYYPLRSSSDEVLRFFVTLNNYCKLNENPKLLNEEDVDIYKAKLRLLAYGLWGRKLNQATCEHFDFAGNPYFCKIVVGLSMRHLNWLKDEKFANLLVHLCAIGPAVKITDTLLADVKKLSELLTFHTASLLVCLQNNSESSFEKLSNPQKLEIYHDLLIHKDAIVAVVGNAVYAAAFEKVSKDVAALTNKLETYRKVKQNYTGMMRTLKNMLGEYTVHDKIVAVDVAITSIKSGDFAKLWDAKTQQPSETMAALRQGVLGATAKDFVEYVETRVPSLKGGG